MIENYSMISSEVRMTPPVYNDNTVMLLCTYSLWLTVSISVGIESSAMNTILQ